MTPLREGGIDIFYLDESARHPNFFVTGVRVPFLRKLSGNWTFVWEETHDAADKWRRALSRKHHIKFRNELHAHEILGRKGLLHRDNRNLSVDEAYGLYRDALESLAFLQTTSILTVSASTNSQIAGSRGMEACLHAMFQRIGKQVDADNVTA
jgi:hypothetical protein